MRHFILKDILSIFSYSIRSLKSIPQEGRIKYICLWQRHDNRLENAQTGRNLTGVAVALKQEQLQEMPASFSKDFAQIQICHNKILWSYQSLSDFVEL